MSLFARQPALNAHRWMGIFLGGLLFLVCLSGTLVVFNQEFERWEQADIPEFNTVSPAAVGSAIDEFVARYPQPTEHYHVVFPSSGIPRLVVENDHKALFATQSGELLESEHFPWSKMLVDMHYYLHLPSTWGLLVVSALGAIICALVVSGFFAHKRIVKDAFKWRRGGTGQPGRIDLHNRFGVWASPFHMMIGITGTYFGLAGILLTVVAQLDTQGDREAVMDKIFTPEPVLEQPLGTPDITTALRRFNAMETGHQPIFLTVHDVGTPQQFIEIYAQVPNQLIYSENYRFDSEGKFLGTGGYENGPWGKKLIYSLYRLHFGDFAGWPVKLLYFVLGLMLTALCVSGMDVWLEKQGRPARLNRLWQGFVWGSVSALAITAAITLFVELSAYVAFWGLLLLACAMSTAWVNMNRYYWLVISAVSCLVLLMLHMAKYGGQAWSQAGWPVNSLLVAFILWCGWNAYQQRKLDTSNP